MSFTEQLYVVRVKREGGKPFFWTIFGFATIFTRKDADGVVKNNAYNKKRKMDYYEEIVVLPISKEIADELHRLKEEDVQNT